MKKAIHPQYTETTVICSCGNTFVTRSTAGEKLRPEVCSSCHPFYTGKQKTTDAVGRVSRFNDRYGKPKAAAATTTTPEK